MLNIRGMSTAEAPLKEGCAPESVVLRGLRALEATRRPVRVTTVFNKLLALQGAFVQRVEFTADGISILTTSSALRARLLERSSGADVCGQIIELRMSPDCS